MEGKNNWFVAHFNPVLSPLWLQINHILHKRNIGFRFQNLQFLWIMPPSKRTCVWSSKSDSWGDATSEKIISIQRCALNKKEKQVEKKKNFHIHKEGVSSLWAPVTPYLWGLLTGRSLGFRVNDRPCLVGIMWRIIY